MPRDLGDRLDRADLVVGVHDRDEGRVVGEQLPDAIGRDDARLIDRDERRPPAAPGERLQRVQHGLVLDRAREQMTTAGRLERLGGAADGEVVRLGAAAREHDFGRIGIDERRHRRSGVVQDRFGLLAEMMHARGIPELVAGRANDGLDDLGREGGRRVVVKIDTHQ